MAQKLVQMSYFPHIPVCYILKLPWCILGFLVDI